MFGQAQWCETARDEINITAIADCEKHMEPRYRSAGSLARFFYGLTLATVKTFWETAITSI